MIRRKGVSVWFAAVGVVLGAAVEPTGVARASAPAPVAQPATKTVTTACSADFAAGDSRLGPAGLPNSGDVGYELKGYDRTGSLAPAAFLAEYYDSTLYGGAGGWIYPPQNGYELRADGTPIIWHKTIPAGRTIDRFGSEYGAFLSPAGTPYDERAIPPSNLDGTPAAGCNYHRYLVLKPFEVDAGPIAGWFAQPGDGWQYQLLGSLVPGAPASLNVLWLVDNGYLQRLAA